MSSGPEGVMLRPMLLAAILAALVLGWLLGVGVGAREYGLGFGTALSTTLMILLVAMLGWWTARALKRLEVERHKFISLADQSTQFIAMCDMAFQPFYINEAGRQLVGLDSLDAAGATPAKEFFFPEDRRFIYDEFFPRVLRDGRAEVEVRFRHFKTGEALWMICNAFVIKDEEGRPVGLGTVGHNITERKKMEQALSAAQEQLRQHAENLERRAAERAEPSATATEQLAKRVVELAEANAAIESFSYTVSHDLRAPLRQIMHLADLVCSGAAGKLNSDHLGYLRLIQTCAGRMSKMIEDLLRFARVGRVELKLLEIDLEPLFTEAVQALEPATHGRTVDWKLGALPVVYGDPTLLRQVLANLVDNALKFTRPCARAVIEIGCRPAPGEHVFFVRDNGVGFDPCEADRLFGVFQRLHPSSEFEGTGIGLASVRSIIQRHGGRVWAESTPGQGTTVYFSLPAVAVPVLEQEPSRP